MKYIDAEKLVEHLDKMLEKYPKNYQILVILDYITSLQQEQPEVDLEKEIERYYYDNFAFISSVHIPTLDILTDIAKHFYELGEARKGEW